MPPLSVPISRHLLFIIELRVQTWPFGIFQIHPYSWTFEAGHAAGWATAVSSIPRASNIWLGISLWWWWCGVCIEFVSVYSFYNPVYIFFCHNIFLSVSGPVVIVISSSSAFSTIFSQFALVCLSGLSWFVIPVCFCCSPVSLVLVFPLVAPSSTTYVIPIPLFFLLPSSSPAVSYLPIYLFLLFFCPTPLAWPSLVSGFPSPAT